MAQKYRPVGTVYEPVKEPSNGSNALGWIVFILFLVAIFGGGN
ncbi:hypothetical protein [Methylomagnum ishizawai]|nr:hypothetical protein [Methylomagnum ishizawai]BBL77561.1 hypothetical protein MishRS11D_46590 [Methylomagnum ishizawai]